MSERVSDAEQGGGDDAGDEMEGVTGAAPATEDAAAAANAADGSAVAEHAAVESGLSSDEDAISNGVHAAAPRTLRHGARWQGWVKARWWQPPTNSKRGA